MSAYRGWKESEVRHKRSAADDNVDQVDKRRRIGHATSETPTCGFTAINTSTPGLGVFAPIGTDQDPFLHTDTDGDGRIESRRTSVASEYLGRDGLQPSVPLSGPPSQPLHGPAMQKIANRGKKRADTTGSAATTRSRSKANVAKTIHVTKPGLSTSSAPDANTKSSVETRSLEKLSTTALSQSSKEKLASFKYGAREQGNAGTVSDREAVSVYQSVTSMDLVGSLSSPTSLEGLRASQGNGYTAYQGVSKPVDSINTIEYAQPWLNRTASSREPSSSPDKRVLRPRRLSIARQPTLSPVSEEDKPDVILAAIPSQLANSHVRPGLPRLLAQENVTRSFKPQTRKTPRSAEQPEDDMDEYFNSDDDELAELMLASAERDSQQTSGWTNRYNPQSLLTSLNSDAACETASKRRTVGVTMPKPISGTEKIDFCTLDDDGEDLSEMIDLTQAVEETHGPPVEVPPRERKQNMRDVDPSEDYGGALLSDAELKFIAQAESSNTVSQKPIVRNPFPDPIRDRSPLFGVSSSSTLRTCFRLGEALNAGSQAARSNRDVFLELYARVTSSWREPKPSRKQHFVFKDLYHDKPPYLTGTFELFDQSELWELDSKTFLTRRPGGIMCRCVGRMKRAEGKWRLEIFSIWEASWEEVDYVAGIYTA